MHWVKNRLAWLLLTFYFKEEDLAVACYATLVNLGIKKSSVAFGIIKIIRVIRALYRYHIESLSAVRALRLDTLLNLAVELSCFFQHHHIAHFVTGSIAYWAIGGDRNKPLFFGDLDIVVVTASRDFLFEELTRSGWHVRHKKHGLRIHKPTDRKLSACVFVLIPKGDYADQLDTQITHIPREYLVPTRVRVLDKSIYVASEKYIEAIRPLINKKRSLLMVDKTIIGKTVVAESHCQGART